MKQNSKLSGEALSIHKSYVALLDNIITEANAMKELLVPGRTKPVSEAITRMTEMVAQLSPRKKKFNKVLHSNGDTVNPPTSDQAAA